MTLIPLVGVGAPSKKTSLLGGVTQILIYSRPSPRLADVRLFVRPKSQQLTHFNKITNDLIFLGEPISNDHKVWKIIRLLFKSWEVEVTNLKELYDSKEMDFTPFMSNLKAHKMELKAREQQEPSHVLNYVPSYSNKIFSHRTFKKTVRLGSLVKKNVSGLWGLELRGLELQVRLRPIY